MITTITLNVAIDKAYQVDTFEKGRVNRVKKCTNTAGGKGLNVAKVAKISGEEVVASGFVGGHAGAYVEDMLKAEGVVSDFVHTKNETRSCINILAADGSSTELLEPGAEVYPEEIQEFLDKFPQIVEKSDVITISGSVPRGIGADMYGKLIAMAKEKGKKIILDTSGELLKKGIQAKPTMIKPNTDEIQALLGISVNNREEVIAGARKLQKMGIEVVVVSLGSDGALVVSDEGVYQGKPPKIQPVNTVGCGDSMVAAFAVGFARGYGLEETLKYAVAVSAANALTMATGNYKPEDRDRILSQVTIEKIE